SLKHEYSRLIRCRFEMLTASQRNVWLAFIDAIPDHLTEDFDEDERTELRKQYWRFLRLHWVQDYIDGDLRDEYRTSLDRFENTDLADFSSFSQGVRIGYESPMTFESLRTLSFDEVLKQICDWNPENSSPFGPSVRGLADTFERYVYESVESHTRHANILIGRAPAFVGGFLRAAEKGLSDGNEIAISPCVNLCLWLIETERKEVSDGDAYSEQRSSAISFIHKLLDKSRDSGPEIDERLQMQIWKCISVACQTVPVSWVTHDGDPDDPRNHNYILQAINSARGKAIESAFAYAAWVRAKSKQSEPTTFASTGLDDFRELLESQLADKNRNWLSLAVIGSKISSLYHLDEHWLTQNSSKLFQLENIDHSPEHAFGWAAWNAFLTWAHPHKVFLELFRNDYNQACNRLEGVVKSGSSLSSPLQALAQHVAIYYGRGHDGFNQHPSLTQLFLQNAPAWLRYEMIDFIGNSFQSDGDLPQEITHRFQVLWNRYWEQFGAQDSNENPSEHLFCSWFSFGNFDDQWMIDQLTEVISKNPKFRPDHELVERLVKMVPQHMAAALRILRSFIHNDDQHWRIAEWDDAAKKILGIAIREGDSESKAIAESVIDRLGRAGFLGYGELLVRP
ncbi:MAG: hypothetical protein ABI557_05880, partial [Aureliella sp.]